MLTENKTILSTPLFTLYLECKPNFYLIYDIYSKKRKI